MVAWGGFGKILDVIGKGFGKILDVIGKIGSVAAPIVSTLVPGAAPIVQAASGLISSISDATRRKQTTPVLTGQKSIQFTRTTADNGFNQPQLTDDLSGLSSANSFNSIRPGQNGHGVRRILPGQNGHGVRKTNPKIQLV